MAQDLKGSGSLFPLVANHATLCFAWFGLYTSDLVPLLDQDVGEFMG